MYFRSTARFSTATVGLALAAIVLVLPPANAQQLEEIVVTAQRREESLQSTPLSVSAFSPERLLELDISDPQDLANFVPNLSIGDGTGRGVGGSQTSIRGINEARISPTLDPAVGIYIDDVYYGRPQTAFLRFLDVERLEVLRGPQGTLFGKNTTGGAIRYITRKPNFENADGYARLTLGDYNRQGMRAAANFPLSDTTALRLSVGSEARDGFVEKLAGGDAKGNDDAHAARVQLRFMPSDRLDVNLSVDYAGTNTDDGPIKLIDYHNFMTRDMTAPIFTPGINTTAAWNVIWGMTPLAYAPVIPDDLYTVGGEGRPGVNRADSSAATLNIAYDISDTVTLRSITGYREVEEYSRRDPDDQANAYSFFDDTVQEGAQFFSQELQLGGTAAGGRLNWVAGVYLSSEEAYRNDLEDRDARVASGRTAALMLQNDTALQETDSTGIYFQGTYDLTEKVALTLGARYTEDDKRFNLSQVAVLDRQLAGLADQYGVTTVVGMGPAAMTVPLTSTIPTYGSCDPRTAAECVSQPPISGGETFTSSTPRVALEYQWNDDVMTYVSASKGFKAGGTNDTVADIDVPFLPEELWSYEVGVRSDLFDNRARLNLTYFTMDYTDKQITITTTGDIVGCDSRCTTNVGDATINGWELEGVAVVTDDFQLHLGAGGLDARWDSLLRLPETGRAIGGVEMTSLFSRAPDLSYTVGGRYQVDMAGGAAVVATVDLAYKDDQRSSPQDSTSFTIPAYQVMTARLSYRFPNDRWQAALYCTNCLNEAYVSGGATWAGATDNTWPQFNYKPSTDYVFTAPNNLSQNTAPPGVTFVNVGPPRFWGVNFQYDFGL